MNYQSPNKPPLITFFPRGSHEFVFTEERFTEASCYTGLQELTGKHLNFLFTFIFLP